VALLAAVSLGLNRAHLSNKHERREGSYLSIGSWVSRNLGPQEWLAAVEIGAVGWGALENPIFDMHGLVTREAIGSSRSDLTTRHRPALIVEHSSTAERRARSEQLPRDYTPSQSQHNLVWLRNDVAALWRRDPPSLK